MKRNSFIALLIPVLFAVGIGAYFAFLPQELMNLNNFIGYMSSLSTIILVLVYLFTTSQQLNAMGNQLNEMQYTRNVQIQPLLSLNALKTRFELPRYYVGPTTDFRKMELLSRIFFSAKVQNIGNGPAVAIDVIPKLVSQEDTLVETIGERIECLSLREGDSESISIMFLDDKTKTIETLLEKLRINISMVILYKNALNMTFKQEITFVLWGNDERIKEQLKQSLKTAKIAEIDYAEQLNKFEELKKYGRDEEAGKVYDAIKEKVNNQYKGKMEIKLPTAVKAGSFSVSPISQSEYETLLVEYEETMKKHPFWKLKFS